MERKWHERYPQKFRCRAVVGMNACDNIVRLARELGVSRTLLYKWRHRLDPGNGLISPNRVQDRNEMDFGDCHCDFSRVVSDSSLAPGRASSS